MRLAALVPYPLDTTPSQRFRLEQWRPWLRDHGLDIDLFPFADRRLIGVLYAAGHATVKAAAFAGAFWRRVALLPKLARYDAVVVHRAACLAGPALVERMVSVMRRPLILDFDDAIFRLHSSSANRRFAWLKFPGKTAALCRLSRHVVVANDQLAAYARRYNPRVSIVPSSVDTDIYRPASTPRAPGPLRVGWTGSSTSLTYLEMFAPTLRELVSRQGIELHVHSDRVPELPDVPFAWHQWSAETEREELLRFDVGIMPMPDDEWSRGKSAMKALLYMAMGIPAVCSPVGTNLQLIRHDENGLLARTSEDWLKAIGRLSEEPGLRSRLGAAGRQTVEHGYSKRHCAALFQAVVHEAVSTRP
jgi:glycosyltransferase involved in cell wall biosynthesis